MLYISWVPNLYFMFLVYCQCKPKSETNLVKAKIHERKRTLRKICEMHLNPLNKPFILGAMRPPQTSLKRQQRKRTNFSSLKCAIQRDFCKLDQQQPCKETIYQFKHKDIHESWKRKLTSKQLLSQSSTKTLSSHLHS